MAAPGRSLCRGWVFNYRMEPVAIARAHADRLAETDRLLPTPPPLSSAGNLLRADAGLAVSSTTELHAGAADAHWRPLIEHRLDVRLAGDDLGVPLAELLDQWEPILADATARGDWETAAVVVRPSRDSGGSAELLRHGFAPMRCIAVRPADRLAGGPAMTPGVHIRAAEPADLPTAVALQLELQRYDAQFGLVTQRAPTAGSVRTEIEELLAAPEPAVWIAELYGRALGMVWLESPPSSGWIRPFVEAPRAGYLCSLNVAETARGSGVGTALAAHAHQVFDESGVDVALLHHGLANPRSAPFWAAQGYRPLWTYWYRRPAVRADWAEGRNAVRAHG